MRVRVVLPLLLAAACGGSNPPDPEACEADSCPEPDTVCVDVEGGGFTCECRPGTVRVEGVCRIPMGCVDGYCSGRGTCDDSSGTPTCTCEPEFAGTVCEECAPGFHDDGMGGCTDDACVPNPCALDRRCIAVDGEPMCACPPGMHDEDGECVPDTECLDGTCNGRGSCDDSSGSIECTCEEGFAGTFCEECDIAAGYHDDGEDRGPAQPWIGGRTHRRCTSRKLGNSISMPNPASQKKRSYQTRVL